MQSNLELMNDSSNTQMEDKREIFSVSDISGRLQRTVEEAFSRVYIRGEISGLKVHTSGHAYFALKDDRAVIDGVCWRGQLAKQTVRPEDGMEVIATGRLTTYPGRSKYQIVVESIEVAGQGALLKLLEDRKRKLASEGLFAPERKVPLPFLPEVIGIVTSPTGAVIKDILHRMQDRFPRRVLLWPVLVQGEGAAKQIAEAISGFNTLPKNGPTPRPDVLIVGRGGGSLEDLWAFNEEVVVRATAQSFIPIISAVGHETDTTLIDYASDRRAPTPTAAAEMAVPVRADLMMAVQDRGNRMFTSWGRMVSARRDYIRALSRGVPDVRQVLERSMQRLDEGLDRVRVGFLHYLQVRNHKVQQLVSRVRRPSDAIEASRLQLGHTSGQLDTHWKIYLQSRQQRFTSYGQLLESYSYQRTLERGYAVVKDAKGKPVVGSKAAGLQKDVLLTFADGEVKAQISGQGE